MTADPHAELRAMLEALPRDLIWEADCGRIEFRAPEGLSLYQMDRIAKWLLGGPALVRALLAERDSLKAEVERLRAAKPAEPSHEEHVKAAAEYAKKYGVEPNPCVNPFRSPLSSPSTVAHVLDDIIARERIELAKAEAAGDAAWRERLLAFEEHRMRCMMAATMLGGMYADPHIHPGNPKHPGMVHDAVDALIAEARRRKEEP